jgi:hypothetical protein
VNLSSHHVSHINSDLPDLRARVSRALHVWQRSCMRRPRLGVLGELVQAVRLWVDS